jgi:hypothetical protein
MHAAAHLDQMGKPAWIALTVLAFVAFWPLGIAVLVFLMWSGRMGMWSRGCGGRWGGWQDRMQRAPGRWHHERGSSGNRAFDDYREETLKRLEDEQREFRDFLDRLRHAKDKAEFDEFMSDRRRPRPPEGDDRQGPPPVPQS